MAALLYLILALMGIGPTLYLSRWKLRDAGTWLIAPVVGFVLIAILSTVLVQLQWPIERWATPLSIALCVLSLGLVGIWVFRRRGGAPLGVPDGDSPATGSEPALWGALAIWVGGLLAILPVQLGGWWFNHLRGNAWDASAYAEIAAALGRVPLNWLLHSDAATLAAKANIYVHTAGLLPSWSARKTSAEVLGWASQLTHTHVLDLQPQYFVLHLLLAIGPAYVIARRLGAGPRWSFLAATLVGCGFWAHFLLDLASMSQLDSLPLMLLLLATWPETRETSWNPLRKGGLLLGLIFCALTLTYVELMPMNILGVALGVGILCYRDRMPIPSAVQRLIPLGLGIVLGVVVAPYIVHDFFEELNNVTGTLRDNWYGTQHMWLANAPHTGFWGLSLLDAGIQGWWSPALIFFSVLLASALTVMLLWQLLAALVRPGMSAGNRILAAMIIAGLLQAVAVLCEHHYWAAVKGAGYVASFCLLGVIAWWGAAAKEGTWPKSPLRWIFSSVILLFCMCQGWAAVLRLILVITGSDYISYINHIAEYRARDFDISSIREALGSNPKLNVGMCMQDPWLAQSTRIGLSWDIHLVEPKGETNVDTGKVTPMPNSPDPVDYWIFDGLALPSSVQTNDIVARTADIILAKNFCFLVDIANANGLEQDSSTGATTFWIGGPPTILRVNAPSVGTVTLHAKFAPGTSLLNMATHYLIFAADAAPRPIEQPISSQLTQFDIPVKAGINIVRIASEEAPDLSRQTGWRLTAADVASDRPARKLQPMAWPGELTPMGCGSDMPPAKGVDGEAVKRSPA